MEENEMMTVTLSREEIQERASALAQYANKLIELEEEEEDVKAAHKTKMAKIKERRLEISGEIRRLSRAVRLGVEERSSQQVLFDEEKRLAEFRRERETRQRAEELIEKGEEVIEQQQASNEAAVVEFFEGLTPESQAEAEEEGLGFHPDFPPNFDPERVSAGLGQADEDDGGTPFPAEYSQADINLMADYYAAQEIAEEKRVRICYVDHQPHVITAGAGSGDAKNWASVKAWPILPLENVGEENAKTYKQASDEYYKRIEDGGPHKPLDYTGVKVNCGSKKNPIWWVMVGPEMTFTVKQEAPKADDFTAERCDECGRIDGAHTQECSKSNELTFDDYLDYARAHYKRNWSSYARKMELRRDPEMDAKVREWKSQQQQAGNSKEQIRKCNHPSGCENEAREGFGYCEPHRAASVEHAIEVGKKAEAKEKKKRAKLSPIEAAIDR
jgi:hypothetical protein